MKLQASFKPDFEKSVVYLLATNAQFTAKYMPFLSPELFGTEEGKLVYKLAKTDLKELGTSMRSFIAFEQRLTRELTERRLKIEAYEDALTYVFYGSALGQEPDDVAPELTRTLQAYHRGQNVDGLMMTYAKQGDIDPILAKLMKLGEIGKADATVRSFGLDDNYYNYLDTTGAMVTIPTGADSVDSLSGAGGIYRRGIGLAIGATGGGKSMFMSQVAASALVCGLSVAYISLEIDPDMIGRRLMSALSGIPLDLVMRDYRWARNVIEARGNKRGLFKQCKMPGLGTTVLDIKRQLKIWMDELGINAFDLIVVDYVDRLAGVNFIPKESSGYQLGEVCMQALRDLAEEHDGVVWTPSQAARMKNQARQDITVDDTAGSMHKPRIADFVISINNNTSQQGGRNGRAPKEVVGKILKDRNSNGGLKTPPMRPMYAYGHCFPSTYLPLYDRTSDWLNPAMVSALDAWLLQESRK